MPQLVTVRVEHPRGRPIRIWVPILPVVLVFAPIVVLAVLVAANQGGKPAGRACAEVRRKVVELVGER